MMTCRAFSEVDFVLGQHVMVGPAETVAASAGAITTAADSLACDNVESKVRLILEPARYDSRLGTMRHGGFAASFSPVES